jgi:transcription-repair coupling factor (superfamily II helicase)
MYQKILDEALYELKQTEFKDLYDKTSEEPREFIKECLIETDLEVLIPDTYVSNISERLLLYKELDNIESEGNLNAYQEMLTDRFGPVPRQTQELINTIRLRWMAKTMGVEKVVLKDSQLKAYFISNPDSVYYQSGIFTEILTFLKNNPRFCNLKQTNDKLMMVLPQIKTVVDAIQSLRPLQEYLDKR